MNFSVVAQALRHLGVVPARLAAYGDTATIAHLPRIARPRGWATATPLAAIPLMLWCDGAIVPEAAAQQALNPHLGQLVAAGLLTVNAGYVRAPFAVVPIDRGFVCFDFNQEDDVATNEDLATDDKTEARVCWPDDSSHHLLGALPCGGAERIARWLDVGTGPAFAPLLRPRLAEQIVASDINPRALAMAARGLGLSNLTHIQTMLADGAPTSAGMFDLITCNAPIPAPVHTTSWHFAPAHVLQDFLQVAPRYLQPDGTIVLHALLSAGELAMVQRQGGTAHVTSYTDVTIDETDNKTRNAGFAVFWWQPHRPGPLTLSYRALTVQRPHIDAADHPAWWAEAT